MRDLTTEPVKVGRYYRGVLFECIVTNPEKIEITHNGKVVTSFGPVRGPVGTPADMASGMLDYFVGMGYARRLLDSGLSYRSDVLEDLARVTDVPLEVLQYWDETEGTFHHVENLGDLHNWLSWRFAK